MKERERREERAGGGTMDQENERTGTWAKRKIRLLRRTLVRTAHFYVAVITDVKSLTDSQILYVSHISTIKVS